jgi:hypothetical protein
MSTTLTTSRHTSTTSTTLERESTTHTTTYRPISTSTTLEPSDTSTRLDIATSTPTHLQIATTEESSTYPSASTAATDTSATCSTDDTCVNTQVCYKGTCTSMAQAAPFGPGGNLSQPSTRLSTGAAVGVGVGVLAFILFLMGLGYWFWRRGQQPPKESIEAPPITRTRSESSATDQKTLVASMPNSPQYAGFHTLHNEMSPESLDQTFIAKALPLLPPTVPTKIAVPTPPTGRYAVNVSIDKSMIFDDVMMAASPARDSIVSRERMPRYRFEEYLPPVTRTPQLSISHVSSSRRTSDHELEPYPQNDDMSVRDATTDDEEDEEDEELRSRRSRALRKLESRPPQLPSPGLPPLSPTYDWYQDIIGPEPSNAEQNSGRTPTKAIFGATLSPNLPEAVNRSIPQPLSQAALRSPSTHLRPRGSTSSTFQLSPSVYTPSQPYKSKTPHYSMHSTATHQTHMSRSWLPDDGLYLPEEGTHDSYMMFKKHQSGDASRPTSYSPL